MTPQTAARAKLYTHYHELSQSWLIAGFSMGAIAGLFCFASLWAVVPVIGSVLVGLIGWRKNHDAAQHFRFPLVDQPKSLNDTKKQPLHRLSASIRRCNTTPKSY